jgi:hypothetical protein
VGTDVGVGSGVAVSVGSEVGVGMGVSVGRDVGVGSGVEVSVGSGVGVGVGVSVGRETGAGSRVAVWVSAGGWVGRAASAATGLAGTAVITTGIGITTQPDSRAADNSTMMDRCFTLHVSFQDIASCLLAPNMFHLVPPARP